jgi:uncharacterized membrane protein YeaQ/YmgE (transglycosylase-associated protein family)
VEDHRVNTKNGGIMCVFKTVAGKITVLVVLSMTGTAMAQDGTLQSTPQPAPTEQPGTGAQAETQTPSQPSAEINSPTPVRTDEEMTQAVSSVSSVFSEESAHRLYEKYQLFKVRSAFSGDFIEFIEWKYTRKRNAGSIFLSIGLGLVGASVGLGFASANASTLDAQDITAIFTIVTGVWGSIFVPLGIAKLVSGAKVVRRIRNLEQGGVGTAKTMKSVQLTSISPTFAFVQHEDGTSSPYVGFNAAFQF